MHESQQTTSSCHLTLPRTAFLARLGQLWRERTTQTHIRSPVGPPQLPQLGQQQQPVLPNSGLQPNLCNWQHTCVIARTFTKFQHTGGKSSYSLVAAPFSAAAPIPCERLGFITSTVVIKYYGSHPAERVKHIYVLLISMIFKRA